VIGLVNSDAMGTAGRLTDRWRLRSLLFLARDSELVGLFLSPWVRVLVVLGEAGLRVFAFDRRGFELDLLLVLALEETVKDDVRLVAAPDEDDPFRFTSSSNFSVAGGSDCDFSLLAPGSIPDGGSPSRRVIHPAGPFRGRCARQVPG
jgi:hypothetical protein